MIVVLDTNIWLEELALNSAAGSALRFYLKYRKATLALPEVVSLEVKRHLKTTIQDAIQDVQKGNRQLRALFGSMKEIILPSPEEVDALVSKVLLGVGVDMLQIPFSLEAALASFLKTIDKVAPSDGPQQFKDGVLWADCVRLLDDDEVVLATKDKAFYANRDYARGLAVNLLAEIENKKNRLTIKNSLGGVLDHVATQVCIDPTWFVSAARQRAHGAADGLLSRGGVTISGDPGLKLELFATEKPDLVYFKYGITLPCADISGAGRTDAQLSLEGDGSLRLEPREIVELRTRGETLSFNSPDGTPNRMGNVYVMANATMGHRTIAHSVRHPLGI